MGRSSLDNVHNLPDAAQSWNFDLFFPSIPGMTSTLPLTYKCKTTELPALNADPVQIDLHGVTKKEMGRAVYTHQIQCSFLETVDFATRDAFFNWRESARSWKKNTGSLSSAYKVNPQIYVYDFLPNVTRIIYPYGAWPETVDAVQMDGGQSEAVYLNVTLSFDWVDEISQ